MTNHKKAVKEEFLKTMTQLATAGFGLVAALAWNSFIQNLIQRFIEPGSGLKSELIYAIIVTGLAVLVTYILGHMAQKASDENEK